MRIIISTLVALSLTGCGSTIVKDRPVTVKVPVVQPCMGERPVRPLSLKERYTDEQWGAMDARQKAAAVSQVALELRGYQEQADAAAAACN